jgi:hypothetical protein
MSPTVLRQSPTLDGGHDQSTAARPKCDAPCRFSGIEVILKDAGDSTAASEMHARQFRASRVRVDAHSCRPGPLYAAGGEPIASVPETSCSSRPAPRDIWDIRETVRGVFVGLAAASWEGLPSCLGRARQ